jgi:response regulator RpfG family c-di-GMP phosphodiesterase
MADSIKKNILLVDDNEMHLALIGAVLKDDYEGYAAESGNAAITKLCKDDFVPSLILLDIIMPEMDGWEVYHKIKGISILKDVPIAFLTAVGNENEERKAYEIGVHDYIIKSDDIQDFKMRVKNIINKSL